MGAQRFMNLSKWKGDLATKQNRVYRTLWTQWLTVRPIVEGLTCCTKPLSELIDIILDNSGFLKKYSSENNGSTILVTFDVKSLYTRILHNYGIEAINFWIGKHTQTLHRRFLREFVFGSIKTMLENNNCAFNKFCKEIIGAAMGTIFASTYATLTMGYFEFHLYDVYEVKWGRNFGADS